MNFLYPSFLWALFAVAIPILIHLFDLQRPKKTGFTNVRFLKTVKESTNKQLKLKHYLVLLSRILFIIFLVLAFAQPYIDKGDQKSNETPHVGIYLDNSFSMQNEITKKPLLSTAIENVKNIVSIFPPNTKYYYLDNNFRGKDQYATNGEKILDRLTETEYSPNYRKAKDVLKRQFNNINNKTSSNNKHFFYISDFQKSTTGELENIKNDTSFQLNFLPVANQQISNVYIDSVWLKNPFIKPNDNNELKIKVANSGNQSINNLKVKLIINNNQISSASVSAPANTSTNTSMNFSISGKGYKKCRLEFEDYPVTFDNSYYFTLQVAPKVNVYIINSGNNNMLKNVYSNESIFKISQSNFGNVTINKFKTSDVIIIEGADKLDPSFWDNLNKFVKNGGHVFLFPSSKPNEKTIGELSGNLKLPNITVSKEAKDPDSLVNEKYGLKPPDQKNPFFENIFNNVNEKMNMPNSIPVIDWPGGGNNIIKYKTGEPFISYFELEKGRIYLCSSPLNKNYTTLYKHALFVPVMYKAGILSTSQNEKLAYSFNKKNINVEVKNSFKDQVYSIQRKNNKFIPPQTLRGNQLIFEIPSNKMTAGFYNLMFKNNKIRTIAFNYDKNESIMNFYKEDVLKSFSNQYKNTSVYNANDAAAFIEDYKAASISLNLWKYCLIFSLLFLLTEILLLRLWK